MIVRFAGGTYFIDGGGQTFAGGQYLDGADTTSFSNPQGYANPVLWQTQSQFGDSNVSSIGGGADVLNAGGDIQGFWNFFAAQVEQDGNQGSKG